MTIRGRIYRLIRLWKVRSRRNRERVYREDSKLLQSIQCRSELKNGGRDECK